MSTKSRARASRGVQALTMAAAVAGGATLVAGPAHAVLPVPTITGVFVAGSTTNKVVSSGTTVVITGTGFTGMTDNAADSACTIAPVAYPTANSGCSQVRFIGVSSTATTGYTLATRYNVVSDTQIYATVPAITPIDGTTAGSPAAGTGSIKVQVVNTTGTGTSSMISASTASEVFYRKPLTATLSGATNANPVGGGTVSVGVSGVAALTSNTFPLEKITGYVYSMAGTSPQVASTSVTLGDATHVNVVLPPGGPAGNAVGVMLVHDGVPGVADTTNLKYPAVITKLESCAASVSSFVATPSATLPVCTGAATAPGSNGSTADMKVTGKGFAGASVFDFSGSGGGDVTATCVVVSDTLAYCHLAITTVPTPPVAAVAFTPVDPDGAGPATVATFAPTSGSILIYSALV
jgi:hypothetical protein